MGGCRLWRDGPCAAVDEESGIASCWGGHLDMVARGGVNSEGVKE